jgi:hypothetical protein
MLPKLLSCNTSIRMNDLRPRLGTVGVRGQSAPFVLAIPGRSTAKTTLDCMIIPAVVQERMQLKKI